MLLNSDFSQRVVIDTNQLEWVSSPIAGVHRKMLDRIGDEVARATSIVKYDPNSYFSSHTHGAGEQFYVLKGTFSDEHGDYSQGYYCRNPWGSKHQPFSQQGCQIFVKLRQCDKDDNSHFQKNTNILPIKQDQQGIQCVLHEYNQLKIKIVYIDPQCTLKGQTSSKGQQIFVLQGQFFDQNGQYKQGTWLRNPPGTHSKKFTKDSKAKLLIWAGHL